MRGNGPATQYGRCFAEALPHIKQCLHCMQAQSDAPSVLPSLFFVNVQCVHDTTIRAGGEVLEVA